MVDSGWELKKGLSKNMTNPKIDALPIITLGLGLVRFYFDLHSFGIIAGNSLDTTTGEYGNSRRR